MRGATNISGRDVATSSREGHSAFDLTGVYVAAAGGDIQARIFRDLQIQSHPDAARTVPFGPLCFQEDAFRRCARRDRETLQQFLGAFLRAVGFEVDVVFDCAGFVGVLCVNVDAAEVGSDPYMVAIMSGDRTRQIRGEAIIGMRGVRINRLTACRGARGSEQNNGGEGRGEDSAGRLSKIAPRESSRQFASHRCLLRIFRADQYRG